MNRLNAVLSALLLGVAVLVGCSQEGTPYTEQTAAIDPALNTTEASQDMPDADPTTDTPDPTTEPTSTEASAQPEKIVLTDDQWKAILSDQEFHILRRSGTEYAGTGRYLKNDKSDKGAYHCVGCGNYLYDAKHKFHSGCGWPSFNQEVAKGAITEHRDTSHGMIRVEMRCARCDGHLGHIFNDGFDQPTGLRHCVNGNILLFVPDGKDVKDVIKAHRAKYASK